MKRSVLLLVLIFSFVITLTAQKPMQYLGFTPAEGSEISSFDITLNFDISKVPDKLGEGEWGLVVSSHSQGKGLTIYEGTPDSGVEIFSYDDSFTGYEDEFVAGKDSYRLPIPANLIPEPGKEYTIVIRNSFGVSKTGDDISFIYIDFEETPLILTYKGAPRSSSDLVF